MDETRKFRQRVVAAALGVALVAALGACDRSDPQPHCGPACQDRRELETERRYDREERRAEQEAIGE